MKKHILWSFLSIFLCASAVLITGCGSSSKTENTLRLVDQTEPQNLDSALTADMVSVNILSNVNEGLYALDKNENPVLSMAAAEPKETNNGLTLTYTIRDDAKWSDKKPVTAYDFEYAWKKALDPNQPAEYSYIFYFIENAKEYKSGKLSDKSKLGIRALDAKTLELRLKYKIPYLRNLLAFCSFLPQRKDVAEKFGKGFAKEAGNMVYNGPFVLDSWKHGQEWMLKKNPEYYAASEVKLDGAEVKVVKDSSSQSNLFKTDKVDYLKLTFDQLDVFKDKVTYGDMASVYFGPNCRELLFKNAKVRKALSLAVNRQSLISDIRKDGSKPMQFWVPDTVPAYPGKKFRQLFPSPDPSYNPKEAKRLWEEGLKEVGVTNPNLEITTFDDASAKKDSQFVKEQLLQSLGINVSIATMPKKVALGKVQKGDFTLFLGQWVADYPDAMTFMDVWTSASANNFMNWHNGTFDSLINKAVSMSNFEDRAKTLFEAEKLLISDGGIVPLYSRPKNVIVKPNVKDLVVCSHGGDYRLKYASLAK